MELSEEIINLQDVVEFDRFSTYPHTYILELYNRLLGNKRLILQL